MTGRKNILSTLIRWPRMLCAALIGLYQKYLSPLKPPCCRFQPSCSEYARQAILTHGILRGGLLSLWRILRCQPFYHGPSYDPVPPAPRH